MKHGAADDCSTRYFCASSVPHSQVTSRRALATSPWYPDSSAILRVVQSRSSSAKRTCNMLAAQTTPTSTRECPPSASSSNSLAFGTFLNLGEDGVTSNETNYDATNLGGGGVVSKTPSDKLPNVEFILEDAEKH